MRKSLLLIALVMLIASVTLVGTATAEEPVADFTYTPENPLEGQEVEFDASETTPEDNITLYEWRLGDDTLDNGKVVNNTYEKTGLYEVTLIVEDTDGNTDEITKEVQVEAIRTPTAAFDYEPKEPLAGKEVVFDASPAAEESVEIQTYEWTIEGETITTQEKTVGHTFQQQGEYEVSLRVVNDQGNEDSTTRTVSIDESIGSVSPVAVMNISNRDVSAGEEVTFKSESFVNEGEIDSETWRIDGEEFAGDSFKYTFEEEREYEVELEVSTKEGYSDTATEEILVVGEVIESDDEEENETNESGDGVEGEGLPGFGFVVALLAVSFVALVTRKGRST